MAELRLTNVGKSYQTVSSQAADGVVKTRGCPSVTGSRVVGSRVAGICNATLAVPDGKTLVLFGPSGSGKTTLLRLIAGVEKCDAGQIWLGDREITSASSRDRSVSMVAQFPALYPHLTVRANLAFGLSNSNAVGVFDVLRRVLGVSARKLGRHAPETSVREDRWRHVIRDLRLTELLERFPHQLSGGERQRVALGRAIVREPAVFLFDEPLSAIDAQHRWQVRADLAKLLRECAATTVYVTHDFAEAMTLADQVAIVVSGLVQQIGTPLEVYRNPGTLEVAQLFGPRGINQLPLRWVGGWLKEWLLQRAEFAGRQVNGSGMDWERVVLAIRPELVRLANSDCESQVRADGLSLGGQICSIEDLGSDRWLQVKLDLEQFGADDKDGCGASRSEADRPGVSRSGAGGQTCEFWWVRGACGAEAVGRWRVGQRVRLELPAEQLRFFDVTSGQSLGREFNEAQ